jgi:hypothetical protein
MQICVPSRLFSGLNFLAGAALLVLSAVMASGASAQTADSSIQLDNTGDPKSEMAACKTRPTAQARQTCMTEVRKAQAAKRAGRLENYGEQFAANALKRCEIFKEADDLAACRARVEQGRLSGSVAEGGILREAETQVTTETPAMPETATMPAAPASQ